jgi:hypothetical protein
MLFCNSKDGLLSLIGIGINTAEKIRERSNSPGHRAYASLLKFILKCTSESLKDIEEINKDRNFDKKELIEVLEPFEKKFTLSDFFNLEWNSHYLPENPVVNQIRLKIENYLNTKGVDSKIIRKFGTRFNGEVENKANEDNEDIKDFRKWWAIQEQSKDLAKYLEHVESMKDYALNPDNTPLYKYYINHRAVWSDIKTWNWDDDKILEQSSDYHISCGCSQEHISSNFK